MNKPIDPYFNVRVITQTPNPQYTVYCALHRCYSEEPLNLTSSLPESRYGEIAVERLLSSKRMHAGCFEHPHITFEATYFPHDVVVQARTHRLLTFDVQSQRYTGQRIVDWVNSWKNEKGTMDRWVELVFEPGMQIFYTRPVGTYVDREGNKYEHTVQDQYDDMYVYVRSAVDYYDRRNKGEPEESARKVLSQGIRQHFVFTLNARSLMHFLDVRSKADAQFEIQQLCCLMLPHFREWMPEVAAWYEKHRYGKALLAP